MVGAKAAIVEPQEPEGGLDDMGAWPCEPHKVVWHAKSVLIVSIAVISSRDGFGTKRSTRRTK